MDGAIRLGAVIIKTIIRMKMKEPIADTVLDMADLLESLGLKQIELRKATRQFENMGDNIAESCEKILKYYNIEDSRKEIILLEIKMAISNYAFDFKKLEGLHFDGSKLYGEILLSNKMYKDDLNQKEQELYERLMKHLSFVIIEIITAFPEFTAISIKQVLIKTDILNEKIDKLFYKIENIDLAVKDKEANIQNFEREYRNKIKNLYQYVNLFGASTINRNLKRYELSIAYVELEMCRKIYEEERVSVEDVLRSRDIIWINGDAGSGKTTFLQWVASNAATNSLKVLEGLIPIMIELRSYNCKSLGLRAIIERVMKDNSYSMPQGWIENLLKKGKFVLLIDGIDEIKKEDQNSVLDWLEEILSTNPVKVIITSRPQIELRPISNYIEINMLPMSPRKVKDFLDYWHIAVLVERGKTDEGNAGKMALKLYDKINSIDSLQKLAANPLLCAMICAIHFQKGALLPKDKKELYEDCCKMLIDDRDVERNISVSDNKLTYEQKKIILARLAYWMMKNGNMVETEKSVAAGCVKRTIDSMQFGLGSAEDILENILERSGILREPQKGYIDFIHKTFQEYLAAYEISREEDWGFLSTKAGDEFWYETIVIGSSFANKKYASELISKIFNKYKSSGITQKYLFIALACASNTIELDKELRIRIEEEAKKIIPPHLEDVKSLSEAGDFVVPFLKYDKTYSENEIFACIKTLRLIGSRKSLKAICSFLKMPLSRGALNEIADFLSFSTVDEIKEVGIDEEILNYIKLVAKGEYLEIDDRFIFASNLTDEAGKENLCFNNVEVLKILNRSGESCNGLYRAFVNIQELIVLGKFTSFEFLKCFPKLSSLTINTSDRRFEIEDLGSQLKYCSKIESLTLYINIPMYIDGTNLAGLEKLKILRFILNNGEVELYFDKFKKFSKLEKLTIISEYADELDYLPLQKVENLKLIIIKTAKEAVPHLKVKLNYLKNVKVVVSPMEIK